jgi:hypothetical protein
MWLEDGRNRIQDQHRTGILLIGGGAYANMQASVVNPALERVSPWLRVSFEQPSEPCSKPPAKDQCP